MVFERIKWNNIEMESSPGGSSDEGSTCNAGAAEDAGSIPEWGRFLGEGKGGMIRENSIEKCILSYVNQNANSGLIHETGCSGLVHWDDPEG